jgi:hypothetical protein
MEERMSVLIRFAPGSLTAEQYDAAVQRLTDDGVLPAEGLDYEICFGSGDKHRVSQVWDTQEQLDAFGARLMPILAELKINPGQPEVVEVHNITKRQPVLAPGNRNRERRALSGGARATQRTSSYRLAAFVDSVVVVREAVPPTRSPPIGWAPLPETSGC